MTIVPIITTSIGPVTQQHYELCKISDRSEFYNLLRRSRTRCHLYSFMQWFQQSGTITPEWTQQNRRGNVEASSSYDLRPNFL